MNLQRAAARILIVIILSVLGEEAGTQETASGATTFRELDALHTAQEWASLVSEANVAGLDTLLNDRYIHIHGTALVESKGQFLEAFRNGSRKYDPITIEEAAVRVFGSSAVVTGKFVLKAVVRGKTLEGINRFGLVLVKTEHGQQVVSFQATPVPQQK